MKEIPVKEMKAPKAKKLEPVAVRPDGMPMRDKKPKIDDDYEAQDALRTLMKASEIRRDADLMKRVAKHGKNEKRKINSVAELKERANARRSEIAHEGEEEID